MSFRGPLKELVVFPRMILPLFIARVPSLRALDEALAADSQIALISQSENQHAYPDGAQLPRIGVQAQVLQTLRLPDGSTRVMVECRSRIRMTRWLLSTCLLVTLTPLARASASEPDPTGLEFFEKSVRPLLAERCFKCHGPEKAKAGLRLDSRASILNGGDNGPATKAKMKAPWGIATGPDGSLYIADFLTYRIRRVGPDGIITTVAGNGTPGFSGDGGPATAAQLSPIGIAVASDGSLLIPDSFNMRIRRVGLDGIVVELPEKQI